MAKVLVNRNDKSVLIKAVLHPDELLDSVTADEVISYYSNKLYMLLDRIGKEKVMEYFNLKENNEKNGGIVL